MVELHPEMFEPYERLIEITVCGEKKCVPENNTILRCLQYLDVERISAADLCWNGECLDCRVTIRKGSKTREVIACRTKAEEGMDLVSLSPSLL